MIVLLATVAVVCVGIVVVAVGRGGQIAEFTHDAPPLELPARRPIAGTDVALLRLPAGPWGYSFRATDDALRRIAHALTERDTRIAVLEQQVSELRSVRPAADRTDSDEPDPGSPWFDRSASFAGRRSPVSPRTGQAAAALGAPPADGRTDEAPAEADDRLADEVPDADAPQAGEPWTDTPEERASRAAAPGDDAEPADGAAEPAAAGPAWVRQKAWSPATPWPQSATKPKATEPDEDWAFEDDDEPAPETVAKSAPEPAPERTAERASAPATESGPGTAGEAAAGSASESGPGLDRERAAERASASTVESGPDTAVKVASGSASGSAPALDPEPAAEPASATAAESGSRTAAKAAPESAAESAASRLGFSPQAPWPGDRLVASSRPGVEADEAGGERAEDTAGAAGDAVDDEDAGGDAAGDTAGDAVDDAPDSEADGTTGTRTDDEADASADEPGTPAAAAEPRGEGH